MSNHYAITYESLSRGVLQVAHNLEVAGKDSPHTKTFSQNATWLRGLVPRLWFYIEEQVMDRVAKVVGDLEAQRDGWKARAIRAEQNVLTLTQGGRVITDEGVAALDKAETDLKDPTMDPTNVQATPDTVPSGAGGADGTTEAPPTVTGQMRR